MRAFLVSAAAATVLLGTAAVAAPADEQAIRDLEKRWGEMVTARDVSGVIGLYAPDGVILPPNMPPSQGAAALTEVWTGMLATPGIKLNIAPEVVEVASSGDLAYDRGAYVLTTNDAAGKAMEERGKYVVVWKKVGGEWKVAADMFSPNAAPSTVP